MSAAQDARAVLQAADRAMGASNLKSIQYSGSGWTAAFGQSHDPAGEYPDWPRFEMPTYTRAIDYEAKSSKEELTRRQGNYPPQGGGGTPIRGEQRQSFMVSDNYAWNLQGTSPVPAFGAAEQRGLEIWRSPHGFVKAGLAASNPTAFTRIEDDVPYTIVTFQYTDVPDHYIDYKDFGGVQFPARVHHHQGDAHVRLAAHGLYDLRAAVLSSAGLLCLAPLRVRFNCPRAMVKRP